MGLRGPGFGATVRRGSPTPDPEGAFRSYLLGFVANLRLTVSPPVAPQEDEVGLPPSPYPLPPLTHYCQRQHVNGSALLPYFKAIQQLVPNSTVIEDVVQQLGKLSRCERSTDVPAPTVPSKRLEQKRFLSAVLRELSLCFKSL